MKLSPPDHGFFVGYFRKTSPAILRFALLTALALTGALFGGGLALALATDDSGSGRYVDRLAGGMLAGRLELLPYPVLRVSAGPAGPARAVLLGGQGKSAPSIGDTTDGSYVELGGTFVERGDLSMLLVNSGIAPRSAPEGAIVAEPAAPVPLGRWRLAGEICDGKCYAGAMKPGQGLAHKACANLCVTGGLPPVLVMELPVEGSTTLLLADADGGPLPAGLLDLTAIPVALEGVLERRDDLLVLRVDLTSVHPL